MTHAVAVVLEDQVLTLSRTLGLLRRRNVPLADLSFAAGASDGASRLTAIVREGEAAAEKLAELLRRIVGVREAQAYAIAGGIERELALVTVRKPAGDAGALFDVLALYRAAVLREEGDVVLAEVVGPPEFVVSCVGALRAYDVLDVVRSRCAVPDRTAAARPA